MNILNGKCFELLNNKNERDAFECFLENAKTGDSLANYMVGEMYLNGSGITEDPKNACQFYLNSQEPLALYRLGQIYYHGWGSEVNYQDAREWFLKAVERGLVEANYYLGCIYYYGYGLDKNIGMAIERLEKVANSGDKSEFMDKERHKDYLAISQGLLGEIYGEDKNFSDSNNNENHTKSGYWYFESARNGSERSKVLTILGGRFYPLTGGDSCANERVHFKNLELLDFSESITKKYQGQAHEFYEIAIESAKELLAEDIKKSNEGDPESEYWMAQRYDNGLMVERDLKKSFRYAKSAAEKGYTYAQAMLGIYLLDGTGVNVDIGQSIKYLHAAHEKDEFFSYALARAYEAESPHRNLQKAFELFTAFKADWKIGLYNELGLVGPPDLLRAREAYENAARNGVVEAKIRLAVWSFLGIETIEDVEVACKELNPFWDRADIKELLMIAHYEKLFSEACDKNEKIPSSQIASASLACAHQCFQACLYLNVKNNYGIEVRHKILLRGINWFMKSYVHQEYGQVDDYHKKEFIKLASKESEALVKLYSAGRLTVRTLYIFAREIRLAGFKSLALPVYEELANLGLGVSQFIVGISYAEGINRPQNFLKAYAWLNLACGNGVDIAIRGREALASQIAPAEVSLGQKLAEEIQMSIDSVDFSQVLSDEIRQIERADLIDVENLFTSGFNSYFDRKRKKHALAKDGISSSLGENLFESSALSPNAKIHPENKPVSRSVFGIVVKVLLFLPFAALFAWLVYTVGTIALVWVFMKLAA